MTMLDEGSEQSRHQESKNAVKVNAIISKLVETIKRKVKAGQTDKDLEELRHLREQCGSEDPLVSVTACHGLVHLVKSAICPLENTISALVASLFSVKSVTGVCSALTDLLLLELRCRLAADDGYKSPYNTRAPLHPLVAVLKRRPLAWPDVLNHVAAVCSHNDDVGINRSLELVKPVLVYILGEASDLPESSRFHAFKIIINNFPDDEFLMEALAICLSWDGSRVLEAVEVVSLFSESANHRKHGLLMFLCCITLAALLPRLLQTAICPKPVLRQLATLAGSAANTHSVLLALLADSIPSCPAPYLDDLLLFFAEIISKNQCAQECVWMCVSALMPWLASNPSHLHKALHTATVIVNHAIAATATPSTTATLISNPAVSVFTAADARLTQAMHIARLSEVLRKDSDATLEWLKQNSRVEMDQVHLYVSALLISHPDSKVRLAALQALVDSRAPMASSHSLTLLLFQLPRETEPEIHLALLRALPSTAGDKNNVMGVVSTIEAVRRSGPPTLAMLAIELYCQLWMNQERCFPQLMNVLNQDVECYDTPCISHMLQANVCKTICDAKPEMHGKELVGKVSDLLNRCSAPRDAPAAALALAALVPLCRRDVVDILTIWRSLAPRFSRDKRPTVLCSLCELLSVAAAQKVVTEADDTLVQILRWLWNLVGTNKHPQVIDSALKALSKFRPDQMSLKLLPESFRRGVTLPPEMVKTPADAARRPEDVLDYVPGECWVQVLGVVGRESASNAVAAWVKMEVSSFRGAKLYQVDRQELSNYGHLPRQSVIRGMVTSLQELCKVASPENISTINLCLTALLQPTPKPLPSMSWAFLRDLHKLEDTELTKNVIRLSSKQSQISPSARKITEDYIASCGDDKDKIEFLYSILIDLCRGIPPAILRQFLERTLLSGIKEKDHDHFFKMMSWIKTTLKEEKIHDANRAMLQQQVKALWDVIEPQTEMAPVYLACAAELPVSVTESMSSTSTMWEVTSAQLQKAFRLRAYMALAPDTQQPLNWLNEVIDVASSSIAERPLALQLVREVMTALRRHETVWPWLRELMGQTHLTSSENKGGLDFLVTVFILCVDIMSGYSSLEPGPRDSGSLAQDPRVLRFPQAVSCLVSRYGDASTMVEWLNHMRGCESFPSELAPAFQLAARNVSLLRK